MARYKDELNRDVLRFSQILQEEFRALVTDSSSLVVQTVYSPLIHKLIGPKSTIYRQHFGEKIKDAYEFVKSCPDSVVVDAGCGIGTEALFFALIGARVHAVAVDDNLLEIVPMRIRFFEEFCGSHFNIRVHKRDISAFMSNFSEQEQKPVSTMVWASEAVSHFFPVEDFFRSCGQNLRPGDKVVICDTNRYHPAQWILHSTYPDSERVDGVLLQLRTFRDDVSGKAVRMADENVMSPRFLTRIASIWGLHLHRRRAFRYFPNFCYSQHWSSRLCSGIEESLATLLPFHIQMGLKFSLVFIR